MHTVQRILGSCLIVAASASGCSTTKSAAPSQAAGAGSQQATAGESTTLADSAPTNVDAGTDAGDDGLTAYCPEGSIDSTSLVNGVSAKGTAFTAKFVESTPSPPARYNNSFVFDFTDATGAPVSDLKMTKADTWMPFHGHGWPGQGTPMAQPGRFDVKINLNMPGYFRIDLDVSSSAQGSDHIEFFYCYR